MPRWLWAAALTLLVAGCTQRTGSEIYRIEKKAVSGKGMVVSAHPLASEAGLQILRKGGNAADAAIAVQLALAVVYPRAGNLGGGGFLVYRDEAGKVTALDYREKAPMGASRNMYLDSTGAVLPGKSTRGAGAAGVPGTMAGLAETHEHLGRLADWSTLVQPAISLARNGFRLTQLEADRLNANREAFLAHNAGPIPFVRTEPWKAGDLLVQPELANTLERIAQEGANEFYIGETADAMVMLMEKQHGLITHEDLRQYAPRWRDPIRIPWREYTLHTMSLPSSGGILIGQILEMIDETLRPEKGCRDAGNVHLLVEAERRAYADRAAYLGDSDHYPVPVDSLLSAAYLAGKFASFNPGKATPSTEIAPGEVKLTRERFETTHLSVVDRFGNAASVTTTLNDNYGCKVWVPGGGYFLNNEMDDFSIKPGAPNIYGLIGGEANSIIPGKRPLSSMTPTIIEKHGKLWLVLGSPGGPTIITTVLQVFLNAGPFGLSAEEAVRTARYHHQWLPDEIMIEPDAFSPALADTLARMGHHFRQVEYIGLVEVIHIGPDGVLTGVADHRGDDHASGW